MRRLVVALFVVGLLPLAGMALAGGGKSALAEAKQATAAFHDFEAAQEAGYVGHVAEIGGETCIANGAVGAMGDHFVNPTFLLDEGVIEATEPEAIVYETRNDGTFKLVALEYIVFKSDWEEAGNTTPPALFGRMFDFNDEPNRFGLPPFYALHAWIWKRNPSGLFYAWNPRVRC